MTAFEVITLVLAGLALLISAINSFQISNQNKTQQRLSDREIELIRIQIQREQEKTRAEAQASLSARIDKVSSNDWRLVVFNRGPATASNVRARAVSHGNLLSQGFIDEKFPMERMEAQQSVKILIAPTLSSSIKQDIELSWDDPSGTDRKNVVTVTL